ncbi:MAG: acetyl-CoA hydrolase/transferase family protein [Desulfobacteraceae bacterium]|nr:acetyl-CoA hydrolase/transferase family protein [Desulfobacteraceae bacterium]
MNAAHSWADRYIEKKVSPARAIGYIRSGQRLFIGSACGEPQVLVRALADAWRQFTGLEIIRMMSTETASLTAIANKTQDVSWNIRQIYLGSAGVDTMAEKLRFFMPMNISEVPGLFTSKMLPIDVALIQVSPPDDFGWTSLGVSVDVTMAAALSADVVIAQVNPRMPRVLGQSFIHVNDIDVVVECEEDLLCVGKAEPSDRAIRIGKAIARLIDDGSTLQVGLDAASQATVQALSQKNDLGFHSQYLTDDIMHLYAKGIINNRRKGFNEGKLVASAAIGTMNLYEFLHDNPAVDFHPSDYVNDPYVISRHHRMVSLNVAKTIDLTGQVTAEAAAHTLFAGISGIADFVRGAKRSKGGKSILMLPSTTPDDAVSNIMPVLNDRAVVVPRGDVQYVATEYGIVNLFGKSLQERAMALISIAHPNFREPLFEAAQKLGLIAPERALGDSRYGVYPVHLEDTVDIDGGPVTIRPAKPVDERRIQEHYYKLDKHDVFLRFFHEKSCFAHSDLESKAQIDYVKDLVLVAVVGEVGFGKVVAIGEYLMLYDNNMAEVAFTVSKAFQGKGLGRLLLRKLAEAARDNGLSGLVAYTAPDNRAMIRLFKTLPYKIKTAFTSDSLSLSCRFDELRDG